jgi:3-dehydroquinate synthase
VSVTTISTWSAPVHIGHGIIAELRTLVPALDRAHRIAVITDENVGPQYADRVAAALAPMRSTLISIPPGELHKSRATWAQITDALLASGFGRDSVIVALGGGVVTDLAGFVAATLLRGVPLLNIPTTVLAMVDAAIGGKTGVDTEHGKNLVGAFHSPLAVIADLSVLPSLPLMEQINGLAEAIKHGVIADAAYFELLAGTQLATADWHAIIEGSVRIKTRVVADDERELGRRKVLNFGHTIGHAVEHLLDYQVPHGLCVAMGMMAETRMAIALELCDPALEDALAAVLDRFGLPTALPDALDVDAVIAATAADKKSRQGIVEYALPARCGAMAGAERGYGIPVPTAIVAAALGQA